MDPVTQGLLGAVIGQLGFRQRIGKETSWLAAGSAMAADLDVFLTPLMSLSGIEHGEFGLLATHRGISHSLLLVPLYALPIAVVWWWIKRKRRRANGVEAGGLFWPIYFCVFAAWFSGPFLDLLTAYGTQIFSPFTDRRFALDAVPIVDLIYMPILLVTLIVCAILRRTKKNGERRAMKAAIIGCSLSCIYLVAGLAIRGVVLHSAEQYFAETSGEAASTRYGAYPQIPTIFVWRLTRETAETWTAGRVNVLFGLDLAKCEWNSIDRVDNEWVERARQLPDVRVFEWFAMGQTRASYRHTDGLHVVTFNDMRYGVRAESIESLWAAQVTFDEDGKVMEVGQVQHYREGGFGRMAKRLWGDVFHR
jgi:inner membrane protein